MKFEELKLISPLLKALEREGFETPTEIQEKVIPLAIAWNDILGSAQTGSGKTLAFALPILQNIYKSRLVDGKPAEGKVKRKIQAVIIAPTRELAIQIGDDLKDICTNVNLKSTTITGGVNDFHQIKAIEKWVDILIATPGRLEDLISQSVVKLSYVDYLCLDEADRMLNMGFLPDIKKVMKRIPKDRQTFFFSATMPKEIKALASSLLHCPEEIVVHKVASTTENIKQEVFHVKASHRRKLLQFLVKKKEFNSILLFVRTKDDSEFIEEYVRIAGVAVDSIHRGKSQNARQRALKGLKTWEIKVLVGTDIASRGLDVNDLSCVINYNIPSEPDDYVHRIGRTARAGKKWVAITFCIDKEEEYLRKVEKLIWKKVTVNTDKEYLEEVIPKDRVLGYKDFEEDGKTKYNGKSKKSTGKWGKRNEWRGVKSENPDEQRKSSDSKNTKPKKGRKTGNSKNKGPKKIYGENNRSADGKSLRYTGSKKKKR